MTSARARILLVGFAALLLFPTFVLARRVTPRPVLRAHEWGVWLVDGDRVTVDDLARESPAFVHRAGEQAVSTPPVRPTPPVIHPITPTVRKPVLYFHVAPELRGEVPVVVRVGFRGGAPWLNFPSASPAEVAGAPGLVFSGRVGRGRPTGAPRAPRSHFWNHLRAGSTSHFISNDTEEQESFVFYDGVSEVTQPIDARLNGDTVTLRAMGTEQLAYVVSNGRYAVLRPAPDATQSLAALARAGQRTSGLARAFTAELVSRGLTRGEATALVRTWTHELANERRTHVISIVPRDAYDAALPIAITPAPSELVRVGVIIERL